MPTVPPTDEAIRSVTERARRDSVAGPVSAMNCGVTAEILIRTDA
jgi:hypothetical protein